MVCPNSQRAHENVLKMVVVRVVQIKTLMRCCYPQPKWLEIKGLILPSIDENMEEPDTQWKCKLAQPIWKTI